MPPQASPFWLCHECGAQTRPLMVDGVPHCASCNSEFIEILDEEVNPDPWHELPPAPPTRPGMIPSLPPPVPARPERSSSTGPSPVDMEGPHRAQGSFLGGLLGSIFGGGDPQPAERRQGDNSMPEPPRPPGQQRPQGRTWEWNFGNGAFRIQGYSGPVGGGQPWVGGYNGAPGNPNQGLDAFFHGFGAPPQRRDGRPPEALEGMDLLQALMSIIVDEGNGARLPFAANGQLGDYVMTENGFNDVLERLMQATGPQGPLPAPDAVIDALPRFTFDEEALEKSPYKDCPVCMSDFVVGDEAIKIECGHTFHPDCLVPWLKTNGSCPVCRKSLMPEPEEGADSAQAASSASAGGQSAANRSSDTGPQAHGGPPAPGSGIITSVLNRLFGQAGSAESNPNPPPPPATSSQVPDGDSMPHHPLSPSPQPQSSSHTSGYAPDPPEVPAGSATPSNLDAPPTSSRGFSPNTQADFDREIYRAAKHRGDVAELPWSSGHEHVPVAFALLGIGETEEPLLFCHAKEAVGDFGMLQMRRVAGRGEVVKEGGVCYHPVQAGLTRDVEAQCGHVMRTCPDMPSGEHDLD